jgi:hypothetical protein
VSIFSIGGSLIPTPATRACGVFSNRDLLTSFGVQSTAVAKACLPLGFLFYNLIGSSLFNSIGYLYLNLLVVLGSGALL